MSYSRCAKHHILYETGKRCPKCSQIYNKNRADKELIKFYQSKDWKLTRDYIINYYCGIDIYALGVTGKITPCNKLTVHHITPYKENPGRGLDYDNLVPVSDFSHSQIHKMYDSGKKDEVIKIINRGRGLFNKLRYGDKDKNTKTT